VKKPKLMLIGTVEQSEIERWSVGEVVSVYDPYGKTTQADTDARVDSTPNWDEPVDGVVFVIPNYDKIKTALLCEALERGKTVGVLKMRANSYADLKPVRALPQEMRDRLFIGEHYQHMPGATTVKAALQQKMCGRVGLVDWQFTQPMQGRSEWMNAYHDLVPEDLSFHHFYVLAQWLEPMDLDVNARSWAPEWLDPRDKGYFDMHAKGLSGALFNYRVRWGAAQGSGNYFGDVTIEGDKGSLWTNGIQATFCPRNGEAALLKEVAPRYSSWAGVINCFSDMLIGDKEAARYMMPYDQFDRVLHMMYAGLPEYA